MSPTHRLAARRSRPSLGLLALAGCTANASTAGDRRRRSR